MALVVTLDGATGLHRAPFDELCCRVALKEPGHFQFRKSRRARLRAGRASFDGDTLAFARAGDEGRLVVDVWSGEPRAAGALLIGKLWLPLAALVSGPPASLECALAFGGAMRIRVSASEGPEDVREPAVEVEERKGSVRVKAEAAEAEAAAAGKAARVAAQEEKRREAARSEKEARAAAETNSRREQARLEESKETSRREQARLEESREAAREAARVEARVAGEQATRREAARVAAVEVERRVGDERLEVAARVTAGGEARVEAAERKAEARLEEATVAAAADEARVAVVAAVEVERRVEAGRVEEAAATVTVAKAAAGDKTRMTDARVSTAGVAASASAKMAAEDESLYEFLDASPNTSMHTSVDTSVDTSMDTSMDTSVDTSQDASLDVSALGYPLLAPDGRPSPEELASFRFAGVRARPRKGIEAKWRKGEIYLKPPGSCGTRCAPAHLLPLIHTPPLCSHLHLLPYSHLHLGHKRGRE
jgi:hypothetical protein